MKLNIFGCLMAILFLFFSCQNKEGNHLNRSFYYWKTNLSIQRSDSSTLNNLNVKHFYIRYFDVDWSESYKMAVPVGEMRSSFWGNVTIPFVTPSIFITNKVMEKSSKEDLEKLALKIMTKIIDYNEDLAHAYKSNQFWSMIENDTVVQRGQDYIDSMKDYSNHVDDVFYDYYLAQINEIQIDCDWTEGTKENFFYFLEQMKKVFPDKKISATLRLWQYKFQEKAGIPPVDRCMLMCYSVSNPKKYSHENSIASAKEIRKYLMGGNYPLPLDLALPIYNWGILYRNEKFKGIIGSMSIPVMEADTHLYSKIEDNRFLVKVDTVIDNTYFRFGDEVEIEQVSSDELDKIINVVKSKVDLDDDSKIAFFSWDSLFISNYGTQKINGYYEKFGF